MNKVTLPLIFIAIAGGIFFWFTNPLMADIDMLKAQATSYNDALTNSRKLIAVRESLLAKENKFAPDDVARLQKMLPDSIDNVRLIIDLSEIARKYGMEVRNVRTTSQGSSSSNGAIGPDSKRYAALSLAFNVSGSYDTFRRFLADLEKSLRLADVVNVSFSSSDKDFNDYNVQMQTYWLK